MSVRELADHKVFDIAQTFNDILLHLGGLELRDHLLYMLVLPLEISLLHRVILRLNRLLSLLLHGRGPLLLGAVFARPLTFDIPVMVTPLPSDLQMIQLFVEEHRLLHNGEIEALSFLRLEIVQLKRLEITLVQGSLIHKLLLLTLAIISDLHQLLSSGSLTLDPVQNLGLIPLQDAEAGLEGLQHSRVLVLDSLRQDERVEAASVASVFDLGVVVEGSAVGQAVPAVVLRNVRPRDKSFALGPGRSFLIIVVLILSIAVISRVRCMHLLILIEDYLFSFILLLVFSSVTALQTVADLCRG